VLIYKGRDDQANIASYRPPLVPAVACRVWSSLTNKALMDATEGVLPDTMFGFRPGFSCADPLHATWVRSRCLQPAAAMGLSHAAI
jgi:hypothetical protein